MIKKLFFITSAILLMIPTLQAQSVDEILDTYFENTGGKEKWRSLESMQSTGKTAAGNGELEIIMFGKKPNLFKYEIDIQGKKMIQSFDGETAWGINPFSGGDKAQPIPDEEAKDFVKMADFESGLLDYKEKGNTVELEGTEEIDGTECFKLKLSKKNGDVEYHFFDTENYVLIMTRIESEGKQTAGMMMETYVSEYKEVDGLIMPHYMESKLNNNTMWAVSISEIVLNPEIEDSTFAFPGE